MSGFMSLCFFWQHPPKSAGSGHADLGIKSPPALTHRCASARFDLVFLMYDERTGGRKARQYPILSERVTAPAPPQVNYNVIIKSRALQVPCRMVPFSRSHTITCSSCTGTQENMMKLNTGLAECPKNGPSSGVAEASRLT